MYDSILLVLFPSKQILTSRPPREKTCLGDEEVHAISSMLRSNETIVELNLRGNMIRDEGCRALASLLSGQNQLARVDLKRNQISLKGIRLIVEALERSTRVRHVHVHAGGRIEAFGSDDAHNSSEEQLQSSKRTVCIVDIRENSKPEDSETFKEEIVCHQNEGQKQKCQKKNTIGVSIW